MKVASVINNNGQTSVIISERPQPTPKAGEVLVRVRASSLNFHDLAVATGMIPVEDGRIPLSDCAGEVVELGEGVKSFRVGDKVISTFFPAWKSGKPTGRKLLGVPGDNVDGFAAEFVAMPADIFTPMPAHWSFRQSATLPCAALTAWRGMFVENHITPGNWVLTQGTGGVSLFALQFAKAAGARVIATSSSEEKLQRLLELGADQVINYKETPKWGAKARELTGGRGVDEVIEIGGPETMAQSIDACRFGGHISLIGVLTGRSGKVPTAELFTRNVTVSGITVGNKEHQEAMVAAIEASGIKPVLDKDFNLDDIAAAFAHQASQKHIGKITLKI